MGQKPSKVNRIKRIEQNCITTNEKLDSVIDSLNKINQIVAGIKCESHYAAIEPTQVNEPVKSEPSLPPTPPPSAGAPSPSKSQEAKTTERISCDSVVRYVLKTEQNVLLLHGLFSRTLSTAEHGVLLEAFWESIQGKYQKQLTWLRNFKEHNPYIKGLFGIDHANATNPLPFHLIGLGATPNSMMDHPLVTDQSTSKFKNLWSIFVQGQSFRSSRSSTSSVDSTNLSASPSQASDDELACAHLVYFHQIHFPAQFRYTPIPDGHKGQFVDTLYEKSENSDRLFVQLWALEMRLALFSFVFSADTEPFMHRIICGLVYLPPCPDLGKQRRPSWQAMDTQIFGNNSPMSTFFPNIYSAHQERHFLILKAARD